MPETLELQTRCGLSARIKTQLVAAGGFQIFGFIADGVGWEDKPHLWRRDGRWLAAGGEHPLDLLGVPGAELSEAALPA